MTFFQFLKFVTNNSNFCYKYAYNRYMRKRVPDNEKKQSVGISLHPELIRLIEKYSKETDQNRSKIIENILKKHFEK